MIPFLSTGSAPYSAGRSRMGWHLVRRVSAGASPSRSKCRFSQAGCVLAAMTCALSVGALGALGAEPTALEPVTLWPIYQQRLECPCQYVGYSFHGPPAELREMVQAGGEICGINQMWFPVKDATAPYGCGVQWSRMGCRKAVQRLHFEEELRGIVVQLPTERRTGSITVTFYKLAGDHREQVARRRFDDVPNEHQARLDFTTQPPGDYALRLDQPSGTVGVWLAGKGGPPGAVLLLDGEPLPGSYLEFAHVTAKGQVTWHRDPKDHRYLRLSRRRVVDGAADVGMKTMIWVGNWNNGAFPYYPDWFYERFPDVTMIDAAGKPIRAGMFGKLKGWPSVDHPVIVDGTTRFIRAFVARHRDAAGPIYWTLGGEALYPTYLCRCAGWPDYTDNAVAHFRAWLRRKYGTIDGLNRAWGTSLGVFEQAAAPKAKSVSPVFADWLDFRSAAMAERMSWHYAAARSADPQRCIFTCNHGNIFWADNWPALGADFAQYADASDGFEMGQIMEGDDPGYYNLWYASAIAGLGKVGAPARLAYKFPDPSARGGGTSYTPQAVRRYGMESFGSGWWHLGLIQWSGSLPDGEWGVKGTPAEQETRRLFADLKRLRPLAASAWPVLPKIGLYLSHRRWSLKGWRPDWTTLHTWAIQHQYDHAILWEQQLLNGEAEPYPVVVCAHDDLVDRTALSWLDRYVQRGGHLVVIGEFATRDAHNRPIPDLARRFLDSQRVHRLPGDVHQAIERLPAVLASAGVRPFCALEASGTVGWTLEIEPLTGHHTDPRDLSPRRTLGQSFAAPGPRITHVAVRTPTYTHKPSGFDAVLRLRRGGPTGEVLARGNVPADRISDNAWTGIDVDVRVVAGEALFLEIAPDRPIEPQQLGVWSSGEASDVGGSAYLDGKPQPWDLEYKVGYEARMPGSAATEAFVLFDGVNALVPLVNLAQAPVELTARLDARILPEPPTSYAVFDALNGKRLSDGVSARVTVPAKDYRVLSIRHAGQLAPIRARHEAAAHRLDALAEQGYDVDYHRSCLQRSAAALERDRPAKALGHLNRLAAQPLVKAMTLAIDGEGGVTADLVCRRPDGKPFTGAGGVIRVVPLPKVAATFREVEPGRYRATIPAEALVAYDYAGRRYTPYAGPLQAIANLWCGRTLAQIDRRLR